MKKGDTVSFGCERGSRTGLVMTVKEMLDLGAMNLKVDENMYYDTFMSMRLMRQE